MRLSILNSPLILSAGLAAAALLLGAQHPSPRILEVGPPGDEVFLDGFHDRQRAGGRFFRWSSASSSISIDGSEWNQDQVLVLRMASGRRPPAAGPASVRVSVNGRLVGRVVPHEEAADYAIALPRDVLSPFGGLAIDLDAAPFRSRSGRLVGVAVEEARLIRGGASWRPVLPPVGVVLSWIVNAWLFRALVLRVTPGRAASRLAWSLGIVGLALAAARAPGVLSRYAWESAVALGLAYAAACQMTDWRRHPGGPMRFLHTLGVEDPGRRRWVEAAVLALVAGHFAAAVLHPLRWWGPKDLSIYHHVAEVFREGGDYYDVASMRGRYGAGASDKTVFAFTSPPSSVPFYWPLALLPLGAATVAWRALNVALLALTGALLWSALKTSTHVPPSCVWPAVLLTASEPVRITLRIGQVGIVVLFFLALSLWGVSRRRAVATALGVVLGAALKVLPGFLLLHPLFRRDRRVLVAAGATGALALAAVVWIGGVHPWRAWFSRVLPAVSAPVAYYGNQSVAGTLRRLAGGPPTTPPAFNFAFERLPDPRTPLERTIPFAVAALAIGITLWAMGPDRGGDVLRLQMEYAAMIPLMLLVAPLVWEFYLAWLIVPFTVALAWLADRPLPRGVQMTLVVVLSSAWLLVQSDTVDTYARPSWPVALMSLGLLANALVLSATLALLSRGRSGSPARIPPAAVRA